jgi:hypothetical protein
MFLGVKTYASAAFEAKTFISDDPVIAYGRLTPAGVRGTLFLKGKKVPLSCPMEFEPVIGEDGMPRMLVRGAFSIDLREFDIEGADGSPPASHTLLFDLNFSMKPKR